MMRVADTHTALLIAILEGRVLALALPLLVPALQALALFRLKIVLHGSLIDN
jgi:hypothetical protein